MEIKKQGGHGVEKSKNDEVLDVRAETFYKTRKAAVVEVIEMLEAGFDISAIKERYGIEDEDTSM